MSGSPLTCGPVPERYLGVWQRTLLTTTDGVHDISTRVYWLQTARLFADLRIPLPTPYITRELAAQGGFAGVTEVTQPADKEICQWHRAVDFQPPRGSEDIGYMHFQHADCVLEDGLDGSYHEVWERLPESQGRNWGVWLVAADDRQGCLLLAGDCFLFVAGRPKPLAPAPSLQALLDDGANAERLLECELSFGWHRQGETPWLIALSTIPERIGDVLLPADVSPDDSTQLCADHSLEQLGHTPPIGGWRLREQPVFPLVEEAVS